MSGKNSSTSKLIAAVRKGYLATVIEALDDGADIEEPDMHGQPGLPLRTACFEGELAIIDELIRRGADINAPGNDGPCMPLRLAVRSKNRQVVALLLKNGATIPENFRIPPDLLDEPETIELPPLHMPLEFTTAATPNASDASLDHYDIVEDIDIQASRGTDTNILTLDLMHLHEASDPGKPGRR